jgi:hypothetical protein
MKANELRIGNWINHKYSPPSFIVSVINTFNENTVNGIELEDCEPIPLTQEWLLKFGFKKWNDCCYCNGKLVVEGLFKNFNESICLLRCGNDDYVELTNINYVHQLQNLYFAIIGEELTTHHE